jgi:NADPH:quinone reductase-like Zn-dependent oxidoreductase
MKAVVHDRYGSPDVLEVRDVEKPIAGDDEVLVKVRAASVNPADWHTLRADPFLIRLMGDGLLKPKNKILGIDVAGEVEAVGRNVKELQPGDEVFGTSKRGAFAEYVSVTADRILVKPKSSTFEAVAAIPVAGVTALQGLRDRGRVQPRQEVLINGASGGVGTFAVQIAKALGANVTGVCSTRNLDLVRSLGADHVIDYTREDFTRRETRYDVIFDAAAYRSVLDYRQALNRDGVYVLIGGAVTRLIQVLLAGPWVSLRGPKMGFMMARMDTKDLAFLKELLESGKLAPVIDRRYPLSEVADALRYLEGGHARGKVVITV